MKKYILLLFVLFIFACHEEEVKVDKIKPAFIFKGGSVVLDSCPSEYLSAVYSVSELGFVDAPGLAIVPDDKEMYEIVGQMAVVGYNPIFLVDDFLFSEKLVKRFGETTFFTKKKVGENSVVARFNSKEINYLAGVFACLATDNHKFAYISCDSLSSEAFLGMNSFALGANSLDKYASVDWIKINKSVEESSKEQVNALKKENFDLVFVSEKDRELEKKISSSNLPFIGYYHLGNANNQWAYFFCDYALLWRKVLNDFFADTLANIYEGDFKDNSVRFLGYGNKLSFEKLAIMDSIITNLDSMNIFANSIFDAK